MTRLVLSEIYPPRIGGSGQWLYELYRRQETDKTILLVGDHEDAEQFDKKSTMKAVRSNLTGSSWTLMTNSGRAYIRRIYRMVVDLHRKHDIKEIHCARVIPEGLVAWFASIFHGIKLVCYIHGEDIELAFESRETRWLVQRVLTRSHRLICNSQNTRRMLIDSWNCDENKIVVLNPGIDTDRFIPSNNSDEIRKELGWQYRPVILTVSRLEIRKGHDVMIQAMPELINRIPNLLYAIVGSGVERAALEATVQDLNLSDHVQFLGTCDDDTMLSCLQACDVFVLPNRRVGSSVEGFGIVLLEAQACAKPVIAGDSGGTTETMIPGETGLIVDCTNPNNLIQPLDDLLSDNLLREKMGKAARCLMIDRFEWKEISSKAQHAIASSSENHTELKRTARL